MVSKDPLRRVAAAIKQRRAEIGVSQETLAFEARIALRHVQRIEAGSVDLRITTLIKVAEVLKTTAAGLLVPIDDAKRRK